MFRPALFDIIKNKRLKINFLFPQNANRGRYRIIHNSFKQDGQDKQDFILSIVYILLNFFVSKTTRQMVVDHSRRLYKGVDNR